MIKELGEHCFILCVDDLMYLSGAFTFSRFSSWLSTNVDQRSPPVLKIKRADGGSWAIFESQETMHSSEEPPVVAVPAGVAGRARVAAPLGLEPDGPGGRAPFNCNVKAVQVWPAVSGNLTHGSYIPHVLQLVYCDAVPTRIYMYPPIS